MDILVAACALFVLANLQYPHKGLSFNKDGLSKENTDALKGVAAIFVVLGHLLQTTNAGFSAPYIKRVGMYAVVIFFVFSGYGLVSSYKCNGCNLSGFWKKRTATVFIPYLVFTLLYIGIRLLMGEHYSLTEIVFSFFNGSPIVRYSWFVEVIILFYLAYYLAGKYAQDDISLLCFFMGVFCIMYALAMKKLDFDSFWYNTAFGFVIGMLWANHRSAIENALSRHYFAYLLGTGVLFVGIFYCTRVLWLWGELGECFVTALFGILILILQYLLPIRSNTVTKFLGSISFELYLSHGAFIMIFSRALAAKPLLLGISVFFCSVICAWLMHKAIHTISNLILSEKTNQKR